MIRTAMVLLALGTIPGIAAADADGRIPLRYDATLAKGNFPNPAARMTVRGRTAWFLFDTGAGVHVVASWLVEATGLKADDALGDGVHGVDSTGQRQAFRGVRNVVARLEGAGDLTLPLAAVADFPPEFQQFEIGGILNPQLLAGAGRAAALDLRVPELRFEPFAQAVARLGAQVVPSDHVRTCGSARDAVPNLVLAIQASAGDSQGMLLVDSGAGETSLVAAGALVRGRELFPGGQATGLAGVAHPYRVARGLELRFGGHRVTVDARVVTEAPGSCGSDGLLGLDALRSCALVLSEGALALACDR